MFNFSKNDISFYIFSIISIFILYLLYNSHMVCETFINENPTSTKNKVKIYNFNTSWCGYSVRLQPIWNDFMNTVNKEHNNYAEAHDIKCDDEKTNKDICSRYQVEGYPTIIFEHNGEIKIYNGERTKAKLLEFLSSYKK
jgi:thiol-disulfide isomerase/thioredoxin